MKNWEYKMLYVVLTSDFQFMTKVGDEIVTGEKVWQQINILGHFGWELVAVVERIGNEPLQGSKLGNVAAIFGAMMVGQSTLTVSQHKAVTLGYLYNFKREVLTSN